MNQPLQNPNLSPEKVEERALYRPDAERIFLMCILMQPILIDKARRQVISEMLYHEDHRQLYDLFIFFFEELVLKQGLPLVFDKMVLCSYADRVSLQHGRQFRETNKGFHLLCALERSMLTQSPGSFEQAVMMLREAHLSVLALRAANDMKRMLLTKRGHPADVSKLYEGKFAMLSSQRFDHELQVRPDDLNSAEREFEDVESIEAQAPGSSPMRRYIPIPGWTEFNRILGGGVFRRNVTTLLARPKTGKTSLVMSAAILLALAKIHSTILDNEMSSGEIYTRMLAYFSGLKESDILSNAYCSRPDWYALVQNAKASVRAVIPYIHYRNISDDSPDMVPSRIREFHDEFVGFDEHVVRGTTYRFSRPGMVFFDWLRLSEGDVSKNWGEHQAIGTLLNHFKYASKRFDLPVFVVGQTKQEMAKITTTKDRSKSLGASAAMSDRINWFSSVVADLCPLSEEEAEQVATALPKRPVTDPYDKTIEHIDLYFNQTIQIGLNRKGMKCPYGIPFYHYPGRFNYSETSTQETTTLLKKIYSAKKGKTKGTAPLSAPNTQMPSLPGMQTTVVNPTTPPTQGAAQ